MQLIMHWASVIGLVADVVGFSLIAFEWYRAFGHAVAYRTEELHDAFERKQARIEGREPEYRLQLEEEEMSRLFSKLHVKESAFRGHVFLSGSALVIIGFVFQVIGSWPK